MSSILAILARLACAAALCPFPATHGRGETDLRLVLPQRVLPYAGPVRVEVQGRGLDPDAVTLTAFLDDAPLPADVVDATASAVLVDADGDGAPETFRRRFLLDLSALGWEELDRGLRVEASAPDAGRKATGRARFVAPLEAEADPATFRPGRDGPEVVFTYRLHGLRRPRVAYTLRCAGREVSKDAAPQERTVAEKSGRDGGVRERIVEVTVPLPALEFGGAGDRVDFAATVEAEIGAGRSVTIGPVTAACVAVEDDAALAPLRRAVETFLERVPLKETEDGRITVGDHDGKRTGEWARELRDDAAACGLPARFETKEGIEVYVAPGSVNADAEFLLVLGVEPGQDATAVNRHHGAFTLAVAADGAPGEPGGRSMAMNLGGGTAWAFNGHRGAPTKH